MFIAALDNEVLQPAPGTVRQPRSDRRETQIIDIIKGRAFGPVAEGMLIGRAFVIIWPVGDWAWL